MESVLAGINDADVYINDVGAFFQTWEHHIKLLGNTLRRLRENGFTRGYTDERAKIIF